MSRNGSGTYSLPSGNPVVSGTTITSTWANTTLSDIATALTNSIAANGETPITANIPFAGFKLTGIGAATARTDAASIATIQDGTGVYVATVGGTADAITLTPSPAIAAYVAGQRFEWIASGANTTAVTIEVSGLAAKAAKKNGTTALAAGDIPSGAIVRGVYDGTNFQITVVADRAVLTGNNTYTGTNTFNNLVTFKKGADIASATTLNLSTATGNTVHVTGTTTTTAVTMNSGQWMEVIVDGAWPLTYHATNLKLNTGGANYTCAAGDRIFFFYDGTTVYANITTQSGAPVVSAVVPVRQTALSGAVDSAGLAAIFSASSLDLIVLGTTTPLRLTAANGFGASGQDDRIGTISADTSVALANNSTLYIYADISSTGTCTLGSTTVAPVYQWGGTYSTTNNQFTFNIQEMIGKVGNGSTATQTYRVFIGEAVTSGGVITSTVSYALMGRYVSADTATLPGSGVAISKSHNIGVIPSNLGFFARCTSTDLGYSVGDVVKIYGSDPTAYLPLSPWATATTVGLTSFNTANPWALANKSSGANAQPTQNKWSYYFTANRGW